MNIKKIIKYILVLVSLLFLAKCGVDNARYYANKTPDINPNPKEKLRIFGTFPLDTKKYYVQVGLSYYTSNPQCDTQVWLAGTSFSQSNYLDINSIQDESVYEIVIHSDYYKNGFCNWKMEDIVLRIISKDKKKTVYQKFFTVDNNIKSTNNINSSNSLNFICDYKYNTVSKSYRYACQDFEENIIDEKVIKIFKLENQLEINFKKMVDPINNNKNGER